MLAKYNDQKTQDYIKSTNKMILHQSFKKRPDLLGPSYKAKLIYDATQPISKCEYIMTNEDSGPMGEWRSFYKVKSLKKDAWQLQAAREHQIMSLENAVSTYIRGAL